MLKVGIIGAGWFGGFHAQAIAQLEQVQLVAACSTNSASLEAFCARHDLRGYTNASDLLQDPSIEAVVIATPHHQHTEITLQALQAGKHVLLEKPMAPTLEECQRIVQAAQNAHVTLMVGHTNRFSIQYRSAKAILESGELGAVRFASSTMSKFWFEPNRRPWHLERDTGGGMLLTAGIHALDRLMWLIGHPVTSVTAQLGTHFHDQHADDGAMLFLRFANGAAASVTSIGYQHGAPNHNTELIGTHGALRIDYANGVHIGRQERWTQVPNSSREDWMLEALVQEWRAFDQAIQTKTEPPVTASVAQDVMRVIFAAQTSSREQREVSPSEPSL
jgi:phthalate 4,5-cis-dihydrodiol dehydrogenase